MGTTATASFGAPIASPASRRKQRAADDLLAREPFPTLHEVEVLIERWHPNAPDPEIAGWLGVLVAAARRSAKVRNAAAMFGWLAYFSTSGERSRGGSDMWNFVQRVRANFAFVRRAHPLTLRSASGT
jgi:hypothetical protein